METEIYILRNGYITVNASIKTLRQKFRYDAKKGVKADYTVVRRVRTSSECWAVSVDIKDQQITNIETRYHRY